MNKILGNDKVKTELEKIVQNHEVLHSYMFIGQDGIGKKKLQNLLLKKSFVKQKKMIAIVNHVLVLTMVIIQIST